MKREAYAPSPRHIPELNGLRVLLVFVVAWYHFWQQSWLTPHVGSYSLDYLVRSGYMPVDGTILLSGFLLFLPYARSMLLQEPVPDRRWFYRRRVMRIVPSFYFITLVMLFAVALPWGLYYSPKNMVKDVFMHFTFTFTFDQYTYISTPIGVASWTLAIEMQAYLLFPFMARAAMRRPATTMVGMAAIAWLWRGWCLWAFADYGMVVNQLPSFLDVYALGMGGALLYVRLTQLWQKVKRPLLWEVLATALVVVCLVLLEKLLRAQAYYSGNIQAGQMIHRFPLALLLAALALALPFTVLPLRKLMGNRVMAFLAGISMNYYLIHQNLAVHLKRLGIPYSEYELPNQAGDLPWQQQYTALCFALSFLLAVLVTYLIEKPGARLLKRLFEQRDAKRKALYASAAQAVAEGVQPGDTVILHLPADAEAAVLDALGDRPKVVVEDGLGVGKIDILRQ
ncbi:MAG: acyltransferase [Clostridia bacterium]|nr:acyltransferase [Clostridia bacterium]